jgi:acylphosphatase
MTDTHQRLHAIIDGRVQGVSFRYYTTQYARSLDSVTGWVRNLPDGSVEVTAEGPRPQLDRLLAFLNHGPAGARVESVTATWHAATGEFDDFTVICHSA